MVNLEQGYYFGSIERRATQKSYFTSDDYFCKLLDAAGYDTEAMKQDYRLTPINIDSVYVDFAKYHREIDYSNVDWAALEEGARWLAEHKLRSCKRKFRILTYDEVYELIDRTKSATAFLNTHFKNKGEVLDSEDFKYSYVQFLYGYAKGEAYYFPWLTFQKEEIRPGEKVDLSKFRSVIVGAVYSLVTGHMVYNDMDAATAEHWREYGTGIGFPIFGGSYDYMCKDFEDGKAFGFSDVGKYDSVQAARLNQLVDIATNACYERRFVKFYDLLGSLAPKAAELGLEDFKVDTYYLRHRLTEDVNIGPVILPRGEMYLTSRGEKSGSHRTGPGNVDRHKIVEFASASKFYASLTDYHKDGNFAQHTGDDKLAKGPNLNCINAADKMWESLGAEVDSHTATRLEDCTYLSTVPQRIILNGVPFWVPKFNTAKVLSGLICKLGERTLDNDVNRLSSAQLLAEFSDDRTGIERVIELYLKENPDARGHPSFKTRQFRISMYVGTFQSGFTNFTNLTQLRPEGNEHVNGVKNVYEMADVAIKTKILPKKGRNKKRANRKAKATVKVAVAGTNRPRARKNRRKASFRPAALANDYTIPASYHRKRVGKFKGEEAMFIEGQEFVGNVTSMNGQYLDLWTLPLNPLSFQRSRLEAAAMLFTKFKFTEVTMEYIPTVAETQSGTIMMTHLLDPEIGMGKEGTVGLCDAYANVPDAKMAPVRVRFSHRFTPSGPDDKEYYINPDLNNEDRLTVQAIMKVHQVSQMSGAIALGTLLLKYKCHLYGAVLSANDFSAYNSCPAVTAANTTTAVAANSIGFYDGGVTQGVKIAPGSACGMANQTLYLIFTNFGFGYAEALSFYWVMTPIDISASNAFTWIYKDAVSATDGNGNPGVSGSIGGGGTVPANGTVYFTNSYQVPNYLKKFFPAPKDLKPGEIVRATAKPTSEPATIEKHTLQLSKDQLRDLSPDVMKLLERDFIVLPQIKYAPQTGAAEAI